MAAFDRRACQSPDSPPRLSVGQEPVGVTALRGLVSDNPSSPMCVLPESETPRTLSSSPTVAGQTWGRILSARQELLVDASALCVDTSDGSDLGAGFFPSPWIPNRKLDCPIRGCLSRCLVRLDRHFQRIHGLKRSDPTYPTLMAEAKGRQAGALLVAAASLGPALAPASLGPPPLAPGDSSDSESEEGPPTCGRSRRPTTPDPPCLRLYLQYLTGPKPTSKKRENSLQAAQHVRLFLGLMADVSPGEAFADNLAFLKDTERCQVCYSELVKLGWAPTTVHCYLTVVANFLHYLLEARLPSVCPRKKQLKALLFSLNAFRRAGRRELTQHRQKVAELGQYSVRQWGLLWANSAFVYEDTNGKLLNLF
ncbi:UNVERIFIED_CONTAM: hypothetical protein FKN15_073595 [Acipenser sinensis]